MGFFFLSPNCCCVCPIWLYKPAGSRQRVPFWTEVSQVLVLGQTSPMPCAQHLHRAESWQEFLRAEVTPL